MANQQLYLAIGLPILFNLIFNTFLFFVLSGRITDMNLRFSDLMKAHADRTGVALRRLEDIVLGKLEEMDKRLSRLEQR